MATEYKSKVIVSLDNLRKIERAQREMRDSGIIKSNSGALTTVLNTAVSVLGIFAQTTVQATVATVTSLGLGLIESEKTILTRLMNNGQNYILYTADFMVDNPKYDLIELELPFIEYIISGKKIRFIQGNGRITRMHSGSGWILV